MGRSHRSALQLDSLMHELEDIQHSQRGTRPFNDVVIDVLAALVEAGQLQTMQLGELLERQKTQTNAFGQLRKALASGNGE